MESRLEIKSLKKALRVLVYMNQRGDATVTDVAKAVEVPRTTAHRILETLAAEGYLEKQPSSDFYRITSRVERLSAGFQEEQLLIELAKPLVVEAGDEMGWPICLATPHDGEMVVRVNTAHACARALERYAVGHRVTMLQATTGYCYLAHCRDDERDEMIQAATRAAEAHNLVVIGHDEARYLLHAVRSKGYCNIEFKHVAEGNLGVPLVLDGRAMGGIVMRYIKSVVRNTGQIESVLVPRLQRLARDIVELYDIELVRRRSRTLDRETPST